MNGNNAEGYSSPPGACIGWTCSNCETFVAAGRTHVCGFVGPNYGQPEQPAPVLSPLVFPGWPDAAHAP